MAVFFKLCLTSWKNNYINPTWTGGLVRTCCHTFVTFSLLLTLQQNLVNFPAIYLGRFWKQNYLEILTMWLPRLPKNYTQKLKKQIIIVIQDFILIYIAFTNRGGEGYFFNFQVIFWHLYLCQYFLKIKIWQYFAIINIYSVKYLRYFVK